jgi:thioredoxin 2
MSAIQLDDRGVIVACTRCGKRNRVAYRRLRDETRCAECKQRIDPPAEPIAVDTSAHFDRLVAEASMPIVVDFWAPWCGPCRMVAPELEKVASRQAGRVLVVKVDTDALADLGQRFGIRSIPTMAVFVEGRERARSSGARPARDIEALIDGALHTSRA